MRVILYYVFHHLSMCQFMCIIRNKRPCEASFIEVQHNTMSTVILQRALPCKIFGSLLKVFLMIWSTSMLKVDETYLNRYAKILNCKVMEVPFKYLGVPVGANSHKEAMWEPIVTKFRSKLAMRKQRTLSMGKRGTLINLILSTLLLFFQSSILCY